ncbi:MAG: hypothetical protein ACLU4N_04785 [Butyricimonas faecihominis]
MVLTWGRCRWNYNKLARFRTSNGATLVDSRLKVTRRMEFTGKVDRY